jgi:hypothetical protein
VIELHGLRKVFGMLLKLPRKRTLVEGVKYSGIECGEFLEERASRLWGRRVGQAALR